MNRARIIEHKGMEIVFLDFSNCPVEEANDLLRRTIDQVESRQQGRPAGRRPRLMIYGSELDHPAPIQRPV